MAFVPNSLRSSDWILESISPIPDLPASTCDTENEDLFISAFPNLKISLTMKCPTPQPQTFDLSKLDPGFLIFPDLKYQKPLKITHMAVSVDSEFLCVVFDCNLVTLYLLKTRKSDAISGPHSGNNSLYFYRQSVTCIIYTDYSVYILTEGVLFYSLLVWFGD